MSRKRRRKPIVRSLVLVTEEVIWRLRMHLEMLEGITLPPQFKEPMKRMQDALDDYEASKHPVNGHAQLELQS